MQSKLKRAIVSFVRFFVCCPPGLSDVAYSSSHYAARKSACKRCIDTKNKDLAVHLEDLDYAVDICLLSSKESNMQCKLNVFLKSQ